jgi:hypothetical protein
LPDQNVTLLEALQNEHLCHSFQRNFQNIILFDHLYDGVMNNLTMIAGELNGTNQISRKSVEKLFESSFDSAIREFENHSPDLQTTDAKERFFKWLQLFITQKNCDEIMHKISDWKQRAFPRLSQPLFGLVRYYFATLLPALNTAESDSDSRKKKKIQRQDHSPQYRHQGLLEPPGPSIQRSPHSRPAPGVQKKANYPTAHH